MSSATKDLIYGSGSSGDLTFDGSGNISGIATYASGTYTLSTNVSALNATVSADININTNGYFFRVRDTLTLGANAHIHNDGTDASTTSGLPTTTSSNTMFYGGGQGAIPATGAGGSTQNTQPISSAYKMGGNGGASGGTTANPGAAGNSNSGTKGNVVVGNGETFFYLITSGQIIYSVNGTDLDKIYGGLGGSRGAGDGSGTGGYRGGGGSGGGVCIVVAFKIIWGSGSKITANGGNGMDGILSGISGETNDCRCGGGGGGGGVCIVVCNSKTGTATVTANGGSGGLSVGTGAGRTDGSAGANGRAIEVVG